MQLYRETYPREQGPWKAIEYVGHFKTSYTVMNSCIFIFAVPSSILRINQYIPDLAISTPGNTGYAIIHKNDNVHTHTRARTHARTFLLPSFGSIIEYQSARAYGTLHSAP